MAVFSIIKLSELEGAKRIDAEYYKPEYLEVKQKLLQTKFVYFRDLVKEIIHPKEIKREYEEEKQDYLFLLAQNVRPLMLDLSEKKYISEEKAKQMLKNLLEKGDILFVRSGNVGDLTVYTGEPNKCIASADLLVAKVIFRHPYYIGVFLNTFWGRKILLRGIYSGLQPHIAPTYIKQIPIPIFSEDLMANIDNLFLQAQDLLKQSQNLYSQAENLLLEELGLKDFKLRYKKTYTAKLSDTFSAHRIDAEYFQPAYEEVIEKIKVKIKVEKLKNFVSFINHGKQPYYVENGDVPILIQKHLGSQLLSLYSEIVNMSDTPRTDREFIKNYPEYLIKPFDVLFYSVGAYLGRTNVVLENFEAVPASFITLIRTKQEVCNPVYLALFLNSKIGQLQSSRWKSASAQQYIYPKEIKEFIIPLLPLPTQQEIASLVQQSHEARKKAKELLKVAKKAVEIAIEEGEEKAKIYLLNNRIKK
jgi:restriction endonuclease S subunit